MTARAASPVEARSLFANGIGDALVTSEHEAHRAVHAGSIALEVIYPESTILSEPTLVLIGRNIDPEERPVIDAFLGFIWGEAGQDIFVRFGFRSVDERRNASNPRIGRLEDPFRIDDLGGWKSARRQIIDGVWRNRVLKEVGR
jgi:sulfate transport system substrate-binding protein